MKQPNKSTSLKYSRSKPCPIAAVAAAAEAFGALDSLVAMDKHPVGSNSGWVGEKHTVDLGAA